MPRQAPYLKLGQLTFAKSLTAVKTKFQTAASPRSFPLPHNMPTDKPVTGYALRETALELGPPSNSGKLIPLLLNLALLDT